LIADARRLIYEIGGVQFNGHRINASARETLAKSRASWRPIRGRMRPSVQTPWWPTPQARDVPKQRAQETTMNKDQVKGRIKEAKGDAKIATGNITGNEALTKEGEIDRAAGKIQTMYGDLKKDLEGAQ
jgi:uncharacterized protein YjbJ (UPF0337 family)